MSEGALTEGDFLSDGRQEIEIKRYRTARGRLTRYWAVYIDDELLAVVLYRRGAKAIAEKLGGQCSDRVATS